MRQPQSTKSLLQLGRTIKRQRELLGLTQETLAERCGFDRTYISLVERGKRNLSFLNLLRFAAGLETSVSKLTEAKYGINPNK